MLSVSTVALLAGATGSGAQMSNATSGGTPAAMMVDGKIVFRDEKGGTSTITVGNVFQSNAC